MKGKMRAMPERLLSRQGETSMFMTILDAPFGNADVGRDIPVLKA